jgi:hypothetical protein
MDKNTEIYKSVIRSQHGNNHDIAKVIHLLFKDKLICKLVGNKSVWYEKTSKTEYSLIHEINVRKMIFETTKRVFYQTADFLYSHAFSDDYTLCKPHYITIANLIMKVSQFFCIHSQRNNILKEVIELFFN